MGRFTRIACCVPFCRRGSTQFPSGEYLCGKHYGSSDKALRLKRNRILRTLRKRGETSKVHYLTDRAARLDGMFWRRIRDQAISRSAF